MEECCELDDWLLCATQSAPVRPTHVRIVLSSRVGASMFVEAAEYIRSILLNTVQPNAPPVLT